MTATCHRITNRRHDPLRSRTQADWIAAFNSIPPSTPISAIATASRRVWWDYPASAAATNELKPKYDELRISPPREQVHAVLVTLGYSSYFADRAMTSYEELSPINAYRDRIGFSPTGATI
jgi:hypothetical protein